MNRALVAAAALGACAEPSSRESHVVSRTPATDLDPEPTDPGVDADVGPLDEGEVAVVLEGTEVLRAPLGVGVIAADPSTVCVGGLAIGFSDISVQDLIFTSLTVGARSNLLRGFVLYLPDRSTELPGELGVWSGDIQLVAYEEGEYFEVDLLDGTWLDTQHHDDVVPAAGTLRYAGSLGRALEPGPGRAGSWTTPEGQAICEPPPGTSTH